MICALPYLYVEHEQKCTKNLNRLRFEILLSMQSLYAGKSNDLWQFHSRIRRFFLDRRLSAVSSTRRNKMNRIGKGDVVSPGPSMKTSLGFA